MKLKINPKIYLYGSILFATLVFIFFATTNACRFNSFYTALVFILWGISFASFIKWNSIRGYTTGWGFIYLFTLVLAPLYLQITATDRNIERESIIISAQVAGTTSSRGGTTMRYLYLNDSIRNNYRTTRITINSARVLSAGDTILIRFAASCPSQSRIFRRHPTREEVERFKNGVFYRDIRKKEK